MRFIKHPSERLPNEKKRRNFQLFYRKFSYDMWVLVWRLILSQRREESSQLLCLPNEVYFLFWRVTHTAIHKLYTQQYRWPEVLQVMLLLHMDNLSDIEWCHWGFLHLLLPELLSIFLNDWPEDKVLLV